MPREDMAKALSYSKSYKAQVKAYTLAQSKKTTSTFKPGKVSKEPECKSPTFECIGKIRIIYGEEPHQDHQDNGP